LVKEIPLQNLLLETDAPDQPLFGAQGRRNEPCFLPLVAQTLADCLGMPLHAVARHTTANAIRLFGFHLQ
jgi:TatD DNase family protein